MDASDGNNNTNSGGWGEMGGSIGDGGFLNNGTGNVGGGFYQPSPSLTIANNSPGGPGISTAAATPILSPTGGSITRFAPPPADAPPPPNQQYQQQHHQQQQQQVPTSFAARSLQAHGVSMPPPQSVQPNSTSMMQQSLYGTHQQPIQTGYIQQGSTGPTSVVPNTFAGRSQQAYGIQQQQQHQQPNMYQQPIQTGSFAARAAQAYGANTAIPHQQIQGQQPQYGSAPSNLLQQQQPQPISGASMSYADRSVQALYSGGGGSANYQQQAQQQPPYNNVGNMQQQQQFAGQPQQQPQMQYGQNSGVNNMMQTITTTSQYGVNNNNASMMMMMRQQHEQQQQQAMQQKLLTDATRKIQEQAYYMKAAMEQNNLPVVFDRAAHMVGELGGVPHGSQQQQQQAQQAAAAAAGNNPGAVPNPNATGLSNNTSSSSLLTPKNYYELYMRALEEMPTFEEYLLNLSRNGQGQPSQGTDTVPHDHIRIIDTAGLSYGSSNNTDVPKVTTYTMRELYDCVQYCPRVVSRLYLQIAAGSALLRSNEVGAKFVLIDLQAAVKCEQNPIRGLFLRHYLLTSLKDKLPTQPIPVQHHAHTDATDTVVAAEYLAVGATADSTAVTDSTESANATDAVAAGDGSTKPLSNDGGGEKEDATVTEVGLEHDNGTVEDSYEFILSNFMEMNKLWVRIQRLPGEGKNKDVKKRRERERNDLRILVGTNLVRLSQLNSITSKIYGEIVLPRILDHIVVAGDPLSQAYIMDCLVQAFPDEYHIETLPILLNVCPRLRDKVNIRTILQGLMDRLANYLADEELLDESDTNEVKKQLARDSFGMFEECVQTVYNSKGPKLTSREVIRLQTSLINFSIRCYPGNTEQVNSCLASCVAALRQANASYEFNEGTVVEVPQFKPALDDVTVAELEKFLSIPLVSLALRVLKFDDYSKLINILPWANRREIAVKMIQAAVDGTSSDVTLPTTMQEIEALFIVLEPLLRDEQSLLMNQTNTMMSAMNINNNQYSNTINMQQPQQVQSYTPGSVVPTYTMDQIHSIRRDNALVSKLIHLLSKDGDKAFAFEVLQVTRTKVIAANGGEHRLCQTLVALAFAALRLCQSIVKSQDLVKTPAEANKEMKADQSEVAGEPVSTEQEVPVGLETTIVESLVTNTAKEISCRKVFVFIQEVVVELAKYNAESSVKLLLEAALAADSYSASATAGSTDFSVISLEFFTQAFATYDEKVTEAKVQYRCIVSIAGTLTSLKSISKERYEGFITKTAQCAARIPKKHEQCHLVALCAHLFYPIGANRYEMVYSNPQRALECLQRCLKLADACTTTNPGHVKLFVDILEHYVFFFEKGNPLVTHGYISGLVALIKEHLRTLSGGDALQEAKAHFQEVNRYILRKKEEASTAQLFAPVNLA